ncbi:MAG TPA: glutamate--tRNA ligase, partial [Oscillatoriaceae cyanobacterium]
LVEMGRAYRCYLTAEELEVLREEAAKRGEPPGYQRGWCTEERRRRGEAEGQPYVLRFRAPDSGTIVVDDLVHGPVSFEVAQMVDDFVLIKKDGVPTYNYAVVIDDATMGITHVLRGDDHLSNTPKQIAIYQALNLPLPRFGHIPMILGPDKTRLSKRHGATSVMQYSTDGYLSDALVNYLVRLGWAHGDQEIFSREEMIRAFDLQGLNKTAAVFDPAKLEWLNAHYIKSMPASDLAVCMLPFWEAKGLPAAAQPPAWLARVVSSLQERSRTLVQLAEASAIFFDRPLEFDDAAVSKFLNAENAALLGTLRERLAALPEWEESALETTFKALAEERGIKLGALIQPTRVAVTGRTASPGMYEVLVLLGRELSLRRLEQAIATASRA